MSRRSYGQHCGLAAALDVVGERWAMLILRELFAGERHFVGLARAMPGLSSALLSRRLRELQVAGVVQHGQGGGGAYRLTGDGWALGPALAALGAWGNRRLPVASIEQPGYELARDPLWTLQTLAAKVHGTGRGSGSIVNVAVNGTWYHLVHGDAATALRGPHPESDASIQIDHDMLELIRAGEATLDNAVANHRATIRGKRSAALRVFRVGA